MKLEKIINFIIKTIEVLCKILFWSILFIFILYSSALKGFESNKKR